MSERITTTDTFELAPDGISKVRIEHGNQIYPECFRGLMEGLVRKRLGNAFGLTAFGVNLVELEPGSATSQKHWHSVQDEMIFVLDGQVRLFTENFELDLGAGDFFGFKGGVMNGHHLVNNGTSRARLIEIGSRESDDHVTYSDIDMLWFSDETDENGKFYRRDGRSY